MKEIVLRLDEATARDLYNALYDLGEHIAAGTPISHPRPDIGRRISSVMKELAHELGLPTIDEAMDRSFVEESRSLASRVDLRGKKVLVVDHDTATVSSLSEFLQPEGCIVREAHSGSESMKLVAEGEAPDLIFLETDLPDMDGIEVLRWLAEHAHAAGVFIMTAFDNSTEAIQEMLQLGARAYLRKPLQRDGVLLRVRRFFDRPHL